MENQVGIEKDNALTRIARQVKEHNSGIGALAGRDRGASMTPLTGPRVTTRAMAMPEPIDPVEQERLDLEARKIGILPVEKEDSKYTTLEEALETATGPTPPEPVKSLGMRGPVPAGEIWRKVDPPRLINFKNVQGIDLENNVVQVDGFNIALPIEKATEL